MEIISEELTFQFIICKFLDDFETIKGMFSWASSARESHPRTLSKRYVTASRHAATTSLT